MKRFTNSLIQLIVGYGAPVWGLLVFDLNISAIRGRRDGSRWMRGGERVGLLHWNCGVRVCVFRMLYLQHGKGQYYYTVCVVGVCEREEVREEMR